jgi:SF-assemblin/beta giardin
MEKIGRERVSLIQTKIANQTLKEKEIVVEMTSKSMPQQNGDHRFPSTDEDTTVGEPTPVSSPPLPLRNIAHSSQPPIPTFLFPTNSATRSIDPSPMHALPKLPTAASFHHSWRMGTTSTSACTALPLALPSPVGGNNSANPLADVLRERTKQRRRHEDAAVAALRVQVAQLEDALAQESRRRVQTIQQMQQQSAEQVAAWQQQWQAQVQNDVAAVQERLAALEQRVTALEGTWEKQVTALSDDMAQHVQQYQTQYQTIQDDMQQERLQQQQREQRLQQQMAELQQTYLEKWSAERSARLASVSALQEAGEQQSHEQRQQAALWQEQVTQELELLQGRMEQEQKERAQNDDEIVQALNRYTQYLQESLAAAVGGALSDD